METAMSDFYNVVAVYGFSILTTMIPWLPRSRPWICSSCMAFWFGILVTLIARADFIPGHVLFPGVCTGVTVLLEAVRNRLEIV